MKTIFIPFTFAALLLAGCAMSPLKGGRASTSGVVNQSVVQSDNPAAASRQDQETVRTKSYTVPTGSRLVETRIVTEGGAPVTKFASPAS